MSANTIPLVMGASGPVATTATQALATLTANVSATNPDYTNNLPGTLIEDLSSTSVGVLLQVDQTRIEALNSVSPYSANAFILAQLGAQYGLPQGTPTNTNVYVQFSGPAGYVIPAGFLVSDGTYQYSVQNGGVIQAGGTVLLYCVATTQGSWNVPASTVTTVVSSIATGVTITCTNPQAGVAGTNAESPQDYRARIQTASQMTVQGAPDQIKTALLAIPGVSPNLVSIQHTPYGWEVICGGGDQYAVAYAIYQGTIDPAALTGSQTTARNINVTITSGYDQYQIVYVNPPQQVVTVAAVWNTNLPNFTAAAQVNQLAATALQSYINGIQVGQPINELDMNYTFQESVASVIAANNITALTYTVTINGIQQSVQAGTSIILSDPESYFYASPSAITVTQG